jgi:hypothetical protein
VSCSVNSWPKTRRQSTPCCVTNPRQVCAPKRGAGAPLGMRPRRCAQERDCADALASRFRVGSPQAGRIGGRKRGPEFIRGSDPEDVRRASIDALTASFTVASPRGPCSALRWPLLRRARAHLAVVRALPDADFAGFLARTGMPPRSLLNWRFRMQAVSHESTEQDTSD